MVELWEHSTLKSLWFWKTGPMAIRGFSPAEEDQLKNGMMPVPGYESTAAIWHGKPGR